MYSCNSTGQDRYCCNDDCSCSENGQNQVVSFSGEPYTVTVIGQTGTYPNPSATPSSSSNSAPSSVTTSGTAAAATSTGAAPSSSSSSSNAAAIGGGVGGGVGGAAILGAIGAFFYIRHRKRRAQPGQASFSDEKGQAPPTYGYDSAYDLDRTGVPEGQPWTQDGPGMPPSQVSELATDDHVHASELPSDQHAGDQHAFELPASER